MHRSVAAATRDGAPVLITEWGATERPRVRRPRWPTSSTAQLLPWLFWSYYENVILEPHLPATPDNLRGPVLDALTRAYPTAVNGTPTHLAFDDASRTLDFEYATTRPDGHRGRFWVPTTITVPAARYPTGYAAVVTGAKVISKPCAPSLILVNRPRGNGGLRARHTGSVPVAAPGRRAASASATMHSAAITGTRSAARQAVAIGERTDHGRPEQEAHARDRRHRADADAGWETRCATGGDEERGI